MNNIVTDCKNCVFAKFENGNQYGCELARLERFSKYGGITKVEKESGSHFIINRFCNTCRNLDWANNISESEWKEKVLKEIELKVSLVVFFQEEDSLENLSVFIDSCAQQKIMPKEVIVLNKRKIDRKSISDLLDKKLSKLDILWHNTFFYIDEDNIEKYINKIINKITGQYFSVFILPKTLDDNFIEKLNVSINHRLERYVLLESDNGITFQTYLYKKLTNQLIINDNEEKIDTIYDKIHFIAHMENQQHLIGLLCNL